MRKTEVVHEWGGDDPVLVYFVWLMSFTVLLGMLVLFSGIR